MINILIYKLYLLLRLMNCIPNPIQKTLALLRCAIQPSSLSFFMLNLINTQIYDFDTIRMCTPLAQSSGNTGLCFGHYT